MTKKNEIRRWTRKMKLEDEIGRWNWKMRFHLNITVAAYLLQLNWNASCNLQMADQVCLEDNTSQVISIFAWNQDINKCILEQHQYSSDNIALCYPYDYFSQMKTCQKVELDDWLNVKFWKRPKEIYKHTFNHVFSIFHSVGRFIFSATKFDDHELKLKDAILLK